MFNTLKQTLLEDIKVEVIEAKAMLDEIQSLESDIKRLESHANPSEKYTFFEKNFTNRTRYKSDEAKYIGDQKQLKIAVERVKELRSKKDPEKLREIIDRYNKIKDAKSIDELGLTFEEAMNFLKGKGIPLVLDQNDSIKENTSSLDSKEDLVLVHKTDYEPNGDTIKTSANAGAMVHDQIEMDGNTINIEYESPRQTVHFSVNGEVGSHKYGDWKVKKYAVIIPFSDVPNIVNFRCEDTFAYGNVDIKKGFLLCPENEIDKMKMQNPNMSVIGYKGDNVTGFANVLLSQLGYKYREVAKDGWAVETVAQSSGGHPKDETKLLESMGKEYSTDKHVDTEYAKEEDGILASNQYMAVVDSLLKSNIDFEPGKISEQLSKELDLFKNRGGMEGLGGTPVIDLDNGKYLHLTVVRMYQNYNVLMPSYFEDLVKASKEKKDVNYAFERAASFGTQISDDTKEYVEKMKQRDGNKFSPSSCLSELFVYETLKQVKALKQANFNQQESAIAL